MKNSDYKPPKRLSSEAQDWFRKITNDFDLDDAGLLILESALECLDTIREAQEQVKRDGITIKDRFGQIKQHPATIVEANAKAGMLRAFKALNLELEPLNNGAGRPPGR
jgi:P27 family predicted phage terminase small subunit